MINFRGLRKFFIVKFYLIPLSRQYHIMARMKITFTLIKVGKIDPLLNLFE